MLDCAPRQRTVWTCATLVLLVGCGEAVLEPRYDEDRQAYMVEERIGDLVQTVEFSHARPVPGDTLWITSTVVNHGEARDIKARRCGLDLETDLRLHDPFFRCGAYSGSGELASGDSLRSGEVGVITSDPGVYRLRIRHMLEPELWVAVQIEVDKS